MTKCKKDLIIQFLKFMGMYSPMVDIMIDEFLDEIYEGCTND